MHIYTQKQSKAISQSQAKPSNFNHLGTNIGLYEQSKAKQSDFGHSGPNTGLCEQSKAKQSKTISGTRRQIWPSCPLSLIGITRKVRGGDMVLGMCERVCLSVRCFFASSRVIHLPAVGCEGNAWKIYCKCGFDQTGFNITVHVIQIPVVFVDACRKLQINDDIL